MVGPQVLANGFVLLLKYFALCFTAVWIVKAGRAMDATPWKTERFTATIESLVGSVKFAASRGDGPCSLAL